MTTFKFGYINVMQLIDGDVVRVIPPDDVEISDTVTCSPGININTIMACTKKTLLISGTNTDVLDV